ncbi:MULTISPECIES: competence protein ComK [unclassified Bacillus (in: firmicutes)]|uniref:competence protein ComK n=1 Tax=unclassified Bacillus (in: firmicutes) TaxID=185979 RepID=UPI0008F2FDDB|nr:MULTISPECIES: competence protein ComK [unclassified Bacillus (in: firmicutes)]SFA79665.1 competence protein ComK [Bacillus sp. UNCCL13]SFQ69721.1 competence protein ComK [Bacillus sp. cl95]
MGHTSIEEYEINPFTMFIRPVTYGSKIYSEIVEVQDEFLSPFKPLDIIENSCEYFGATFKGKKEGSTLLTGVTHKVPIVIDSMNHLYFFPTTSPNRPDCIWIAHDHVISHQRHNPTETLVVFQNKKSYIFPISYNSFENQLMRTAFLRTKMLQRIDMLERKSFYLMNRNHKMEASERQDHYMHSPRKS